MNCGHTHCGMDRTCCSSHELQKSPFVTTVPVPSFKWHLQLLPLSSERSQRALTSGGSPGNTTFLSARQPSSLQPSKLTGVASTANKDCPATVLPTDTAIWLAS